MSQCPRCGKWNGGVAAPAGTEPYWCTCFKGLQGWVCPKCGRGLSPFTQSCPCVPQLPPTIT